MIAAPPVAPFRGFRIPVRILVTATLLASCAEGPSAPDGGVPTELTLAARFPAASSGDDGDAYDAADAVRVRVGAPGSTPVFDEVLAFDPSTPGQRVRIQLELERESTLLVEVELRRGSDPLFRGSDNVTLTPGRTATANVQLQPVAAAIVLGDAPGPLVSIGETAPLDGAVVFATGDTIRSLALEWTSLDPDVATVETSGGVTRVRAVAAGQARIRASHGTFSEILTVVVDPRVAAVEVTPPSSSIPLGGAVDLTAVAFDALGNPLPGFTATWASDDLAVATVDPDGRVQGVGVGSATISATVDDQTGTADVEVFAVLPEVETLPAGGVGFRTATLNGVVNPNGSATTAWFEFGTDPSLSTFARTGGVALGSGTSDRDLQATVTQLAPGTRYYFRAVASNEAGEARGAIRSFDTPVLVPPAVTTLLAADVTGTSATLRGTVNPNGAETTAWFEWGTTPSLSVFSSTPAVAVGSGSQVQEVQTGLVGLDAETVYYFRIAASSEGGTSRGSIRSFQTAVPPPSDLGGEADGPSVFLDWIDNSQTETFFRVERSTESPTTGFQLVGTLAADGVNGDREFFEDPGPLPAGTVYYRVLACNSFGCSAPSPVLTVAVDFPSIGGRVDLCSDGCYQAGVEVRLTGPTTVTTVTNASGFYLFPAVLPGTYTVSVQDQGCSVDFDPNGWVITVAGGDSANVNFFASYNCEEQE